MKIINLAKDRIDNGLGHLPLFDNIYQKMECEDDYLYFELGRLHVRIHKQTFMTFCIRNAGIFGGSYLGMFLAITFGIKRKWWGFISLGASLSGFYLSQYLIKKFVIEKE